MVLERIANPSIGESRFLSSSLSRTASFEKRKIMKPGPNFKLSKTAKRMMAANADPQYSNLIKKNFIQAELSASIQPRKERKIEKGAD